MTHLPGQEILYVLKPGPTSAVGDDYRGKGLKGLDRQAGGMINY